MVQARVLIVDDEKSIRITLGTMLSGAGYTVSTAGTAAEALERLKENRFDVVVSDIILPGGSGIELVRAIRGSAPEVMIILMTGEPTVETATEGFRLGVHDYLSKPVTKGAVLRSVEQALRLKHLQEEALRLQESDRQHREHLEELVSERTQALTDSVERLRRTIAGTIHTMALIIETRDPYTAGHQQRVANLARAIAAAQGYSPERLEGTYFAGLIHDVGKIGIPAEILSKPCRLSEIEFGLIKTHPEQGFAVLHEIEFPWPIANIVYQHHERMDGSGYPRGLKGDELLPEARILGVADVVEAMAAHRPYRPALGIDAALEEIVAQRGILYDAGVVDTCVRLFREGAFSFDSHSGNHMP